MIRRGEPGDRVLLRKLAVLLWLQGFFMLAFFVPAPAAVLNGQLETRVNVADISVRSTTTGSIAVKAPSIKMDTNLRLDLSGPVFSPERGGYQVSLYTAMDPPVIQGPYGDRLGKGSLRGVDVSTRLNPDASGFGGEAAYRLQLKTEPPSGEMLPFWEESYGTSLALTPPGGIFSLEGNWQMDHQEDAVTGKLFNVDILTRSLSATGNFDRGTATFSYHDHLYKDLTLISPVSFKSAATGDLGLRVGEATDLALSLRRTRYQEGPGGEQVNNWSDNYLLQAAAPVSPQSKIIAETQGTFTNVPADQAPVHRASLMLQSRLDDQWQAAGGVARETRWQTDLQQEEPRRIYLADLLGQPEENLALHLYTSLDQPEKGGRIEVNPRLVTVGSEAEYDAGQGVSLSFGVENRRSYDGTYRWGITEVKPGIKYKRELASGLRSSFSTGLTLEKGNGWQVRGREISGKIYGPLSQGYALNLTLDWKENLDIWGVWRQTGSVYAELNRSFKGGGIASLIYRWGLYTTEGEGKSQELTGRWSMSRGSMTYFAEARWGSSLGTTSPAVQETSWWISSGMQLNF